MPLSWTKLILVSGALAGTHFLAKKYLAQNEQDETSTVLLNPILPVVPILTTSGVFLVYKQSQHVLGLGSCGILSYLALDFCKHHEENSIAYKGGKIVCGLAGIGVLVYSSKVVSDFYMFAVVNGIALTPVVYKYVNKYYRQLEQHVEENENSVIEQTQNLLHNVPQLLADYQSQIQGLSAVAQNPEQVGQIINMISSPEAQNAISQMLGSPERIAEIIQQVSMQQM